MTRAYPARAGVERGGELVLHVSSTSPRVRVRFARVGREVLAPDPPLTREIATHDVSPGPAECGWDWPPYRFAVPRSWRPGVYVAFFDEPDTPVSSDPDARSGRALFVVRDAPQNAVLVVLPLYTYHAYNVAHVDGTLRVGEGECLYSGHRRVSLHRPGGGTGGHPWDEVNADVYDLRSPRQTFEHWDRKGIAWLESRGITYDVNTDVALDGGEVALEAYRAVITFGHFEYWTAAIRERIERYVTGGGNVAFFGGNTAWFRVRSGPGWIERDGQFTDPPESTLTGVSYRDGGGKWIGARPPAGYTVRCGDHWVYAGTGLRDGETFGAPERLVGYECDGVPSDRRARTPAFTVLGDADLRDWDVAGGSGELSPAAHAQFGIAEAAGAVFVAGTVDWARVLAAGEGAVSRITENVMRRFTGDV